MKKYRNISVEDALFMLEDQLYDIGYLRIQDITLREFVENPIHKLFVLSGSLGRGFKLNKVTDEQGMTFEYSQYPEYSTIQSFVWISNRNAEWEKYRISI